MAAFRQDRRHVQAPSAARVERPGRDRRELGDLLERLVERAPGFEALVVGLREACVQGLLGWDELREIEALVQGTASFGSATAVERARRSSGAPLPEGLRRRFERATGTGLGDVRVHTGAASADAATALGARAWVLGRDIHFGAGQFEPATERGARVLAHEVAHTVQQGPGRVPAGGRFEVSHPSDVDERAAVSAAPALLAGAAVALAPTGTYAVARIQRDALTELPAATRRATLVDRSDNHPDVRVFFVPDAAPPSAAYTYEFEGPIFAEGAGSDARTRRGFSLLALSLVGIDLATGEPIAEEFDPARRAPRPVGNRVVMHAVDLAYTSLGAGGVHDVRFTLVGGTRLLIEDLGPRAPAAGALTEELAAQYGLTHAPDVGAPLWSRILTALGAFPLSVLSRIQGLRFVAGVADHSPEGFAAMYDAEFDASTGTWAYEVLVYTDAERLAPELFQQVLFHELGHAVSDRPTERPAEVHETLSAQAAFRRAVRADGDRPITTYGGRDAEENFAECFSYFILRPELLRTLRPHVYEYFLAYREAAEASQTPPTRPDAAPPTAGERQAEEDFGAIEGADDF
jgi:hypothetical protein